MADVTLEVTIPDALVARVQAALEASNKAEAEAWIKQAIKTHVIAHEAEVAREEAAVAVETALAAQRQADEDARAAAEADITLE